MTQLSVVEKPHTFGWIRRPELDTETGKAWERPDGKIWLHPKGAPDPLFFRMKKVKEPRK